MSIIIYLFSLAQRTVLKVKLFWDKKLNEIIKFGCILMHFFYFVQKKQQNIIFQKSILRKTFPLIYSKIYVAKICMVLCLNKIKK